jgi:Flp pilus assembly protein TadG
MAAFTPHFRHRSLLDCRWGNAVTDDRQVLKWERLKMPVNTTPALIRLGNAGRPGRFRRDESGAMTFFGLVLFILILGFGGMAVDFMRYETARAKMQGTLDRAVLAAADLDQEDPPADVVRDYFKTAGMSDLLSGDPKVEEGLNYRKVSAGAELDLPMRFVGFPRAFLNSEDDFDRTLKISSGSSAEERVTNVEISLVLDISGSMRFGDRIGDLRPAAKKFVTTLLDGDLSKYTSISLVPYAGQTNPGPFMFDRLGGARYPALPLDEDDGGVPEATNNTTLDPDEDAGTGSDPNARYVYPNVSSCLELSPHTFTYSGLPNDGSYEQVGHFMYWPIASDVMDWGWCPEDDTSIRYASNDAGKLTTFIDNMRMHDGTGTHYAIKYALALLDPSSRDDFAAMSTAKLVPASFKDRPADWDDPETAKFIVLMTDGKITEQARPKDRMDTENPTIDLDERKSDKKVISGKGTNVDSFYYVCDLAKDPSRDVVVYTIAFEAPPAAQKQMRNCASSPNHYFNVTGVEISNAFNAIASDIRALKLTQ